ncbi:MAG: hypothetical protein NUV86_08125, partial [Candidatus Scalindua sp.]|nr:hypothetical protein [Candidatus Scalindua sp.]
LLELQEQLLEFEFEREWSKVRLITYAIDEIEKNNKGAFCPLHKNPVLPAFLMPFGGVGSSLQIMGISGWYNQRLSFLRGTYR